MRPRASSMLPRGQVRRRDEDGAIHPQSIEASGDLTQIWQALRHVSAQRE
jgi:hypothetical protein